MKRKKLSKRQIFLGLILSLIVIGAVYFLYRQKIWASIPENINSQIKLSQISISGDTGRPKPVGTVEMTIPKKEMESFAVLFDNQSSVDYSNLTIEKSDLRSSSGALISKSNIDERVVHNWMQKVIDYNVTPNGMINEDVDELLVRNEKPALTPPSDPIYKNDPFFSSDITNELRHLLTSGGSSQSESSNGSTESIKTSVSKLAQKKFFFTVKVPDNSQAGAYSSVIQFVDKNSGSAVAKFNLKLDIAKYNLVELDQSQGFKTGCYINDFLKPNDTLVPDETLFRKRAQAAHDHGCEQATLRVITTSNNTRALEILSEIGFKGPIILNFASVNASGVFDKLTTINTVEEKNQFKQIITNIKNDPKITVKMLFYGYDEPNLTNVLPGQTLSGYDSHKLKVQNIKACLSEVFQNNLPSNIINQVTTSATLETFNNLSRDGEIYRTDYPMINLNNMYEISTAFKAGNKIVTQPNATFYFQGYYENQKQYGLQNTNRFYGGLGIINSGLSGSMLNPFYGYSSVIIRPIYDDFKLLPSMFKNKAWHKQMLTFYPAVDGLIPTLQSEGWREGNLDLRYYLSYLKVKDNIQASYSVEAKNKLIGLKAQINSQISKYQFSDKIYKLNSGLDDYEMDSTRSLLKEYLNYYYQDVVADPSATPSAKLIESLNLQNGQVITSSPFEVKVKPVAGKSIRQADFYVNNIKKFTATSLSSDGTFTFSWNTRAESLTAMEFKVTLTATNGATESVISRTSIEIDNRIVSAVPTKSESTDKEAPVIEGRSNLGGYQVINKEPFTVSAKVTDNVQVKSVEFLVDGAPISKSTRPDLDMIYEAVLTGYRGKHEVTVVAYDTSSNRTEKNYLIDVIMTNSLTVNSPTVIQSAQPNPPQTAGEIVNQISSDVSGDSIIDVLPKTGRQSFFKLFIGLFHF